MSNNYEPINFICYNPKTSIIKSGSNDKEHYDVYLCNHSKTCVAHENNMCALLCGLYGGFCPYGKINTKEGFTKRSSKCGELINAGKVIYEDVYYKLKELSFTCPICDYVFIKLPYLDNFVNSFFDKPKTPTDKDSDVYFSGTSYTIIKKDIFTVDLVVKLINYSPRALMGGIIKDYRNKHIPKFCKDIKLYFPEIYYNIKKNHPEIDIDSLISEIKYVGKNAYVKTLLPGKVKICSTEYLWDGDVLITQEHPIIGLYECESVQIVPNDKTVVTILDEDTVTEQTILA